MTSMPRILSLRVTRRFGVSIVAAAIVSLLVAGPAEAFPPPSPPGPATSVTLTPGNGQIAVSWQDNYGILGFSADSWVARVNIKKGGSSCTTPPLFGNFPPPTQTCTIVGLTNGTTYSVVVYATYHKGPGLPERKGPRSVKVKVVAG
jgi:hypothetical protein